MVNIEAKKKKRKMGENERFNKISKRMKSSLVAYCSIMRLNN